jgi:hypothetical protein
VTSAPLATTTQSEKELAAAAPLGPETVHHTGTDAGARSRIADTAASSSDHRIGSSPTDRLAPSPVAMPSTNRAGARSSKARAADACVVQWRTTGFVTKGPIGTRPVASMHAVTVT